MADSKRNLVYGLHAINAVLERTPERVLELWIAQPRPVARLSELMDRAQRAGVRVQSVGGEALAKLVGDVTHQGAVAAEIQAVAQPESGDGAPRGGDFFRVELTGPVIGRA